MQDRIEHPERVFVLSGPSGVGKNTLADKLCEMGHAVRAVTATSRDPRPGEEDGVDYYFIGEEEFRTWLNEGRLLEHNVYGGNYYGTPVFSVNRVAEACKPILLVIDVNGALEVKTQCPEVTLIFVMPPGEEALEARLRGRGDEDENSIAYRLERAREEMNLIDRYDYTVINDSIDEAVEELKKILRREMEKD